MIKREELKVGEKYKDLFGGIVKVLCVGEDKVFFVAFIWTGGPEKRWPSEKSGGLLKKVL